MKTKYYAFFAIPILICAIIGIFIRLSFTDQELNIDTYKYSLYPFVQRELSNQLVDMSNLSVDKLINKSEIVVKCKRTDKRTVSDEYFTTPIIIENVYKGEETLKGSTIIVVEKIHVNQTEHEFSCYEGFMPLLDDKEYILLLNKNNVSNYMSDNDNKLPQYEILSSSPFGEYRIDELNADIGNDIVNSEQSDIGFSRITDFLFKDKDQLDLYEEIRSEIFKQYLN